MYKRKDFCEREIVLNRRLCDGMYEGVLPIVRSKDGLRIGGEGEPVEYTVKMTEFPQSALMSNMLKKGKVGKELVGEIAHIIADFHAKAERGRKINEGGSLVTIKFNCHENYRQTEKFVGDIIPKVKRDFVIQKMDKFMSDRSSLFKSRVRNGKIRDCHGDVRPGNIFIHKGKIYIFDCIEFNTRFRYGDVASEVAFMCVDLDFNGRRDLSAHFRDEYIRKSGDEDLLALFPFYCCYRADVGIKTSALKSEDQGVPIKERHQAREMSRRYSVLSLKYARQL